jgi:hypothetical protein
VALLFNDATAQSQSPEEPRGGAIMMLVVVSAWRSGNDHQLFLSSNITKIHYYLLLADIILIVGGNGQYHFSLLGSKKLVRVGIAGRSVTYQQ